MEARSDEILHVWDDSICDALLKVFGVESVYADHDGGRFGKIVCSSIKEDGRS
jgi:hypothetical protein